MISDGEKIREIMSKVCFGYTSAEIKTIGRSWLSKDISCPVVGHGERNVVIVGGLGGGDLEVSSFLSNFAHELDDCLSLNRRISEFNISALCGCNTFHIIPILNPDGISINNIGISNENPFCGRVLKMMRGSSDFSQWEANIRGTDLRFNFNYKWVDAKFKERNRGVFFNGPLGYGGEYPESELESSSLCSYCRGVRPELVIEFRVGERTEIIPFISESSSGKCKRAVKLISGYTGIGAAENESYFNGSFSGWAAREFSSSSIIINVERGFYGKYSESLKSAVLLFCAQ